MHTPREYETELLEIDRDAAFTALHSALDTSDLAEPLARLLFDAVGCRRFSLLVHNDVAERFDVSWSCLPNANAEWLPADTPMLEALFASGRSFAGTADTRPIIEWGDGEAEIAACEQLCWSDEPFGMLILHDADDPMADPEGLADIAVQAGMSLARALIYEDACRESVDSAAKLQAIESLGEALSETGLDGVLARILELSLRIVAGEVGAIVLRDEDGGLSVPVQFGLELKHVTGIISADGELMVDRVIDTGEPLLMGDTSGQDDYDIGDARDRVHSLVCVPLMSKARRLGALIVVNSSPEADLTQSDMDLLAGISGLAATIIENSVLHGEAILRERMSAQMRIAADIQRGLQPAEPPKFDGIDVAGWSDPCDETGGDYFDYVSIDDRRLVVVVGDVTDHGIGAALLMTTARAFVRSMLGPGCKVSDMLERANDLLKEDMLDGRFMTLVAADINVADRTMIYSSAGHEGPLIYRPASDSFDEFDSTGLPLGVVAPSEFPCGDKISLETGDVAVFVTDGVWEDHNAEGEQFGRQRLKDAVRRGSAGTAEQVIGSIRQALDEFLAGKPRADDATVVVVKAI